MKRVFVVFGIEIETEVCFARHFVEAVYRKKKYAELCVKNIIERNKERGDSILYWYEEHVIRDPDKIEEFF